jgi:hypothetical protein
MIINIRMVGGIMPTMQVHTGIVMIHIKRDTELKIIGARTTRDLWNT